MSLFYIFSKLFTYLVLPPGMFIVLFFIAAFFVKRFRIFFFLSAFSFYLLSTSPVANWLLAPLEEPFNVAIEKESADAVIVLAGGSMQGAANLPLSTDSYKRMMWGIMVAKSHELPLLFSGAGLNQNYKESDAFMDSFRELQAYLHIEAPATSGIDQKKFSLHVESKSLDTYENAKLSKEAFKEAGINEPTVYLVTSAYHMYRSIKLYRHFGFHVIPAATDFKIDRRSRTVWDYFPSESSFRKSFIALHEYFGILSFKLRSIN